MRIRGDDVMARGYGRFQTRRRAVLQRSLKNGNLLGGGSGGARDAHVPLEDALRLVYLYGRRNLRSTRERRWILRPPRRAS